MTWALKFLAQIFLTLLRYPLAPLAVILFSTEDKCSLTYFKPLLTIDNDLSGDNGWKETHLIGEDPLASLNRVRWLWRNGFNSVSYGYLGCAQSEVTQVSPFLWRNTSGGWLYRRFVKIGPRYLELFFGWALRGPHLGRCKIVGSARITKERLTCSTT